MPALPSHVQSVINELNRPFDTRRYGPNTEKIAQGFMREVMGLHWAFLKKLFTELRKIDSSIPSFAELQKIKSYQPEVSRCGNHAHLIEKERNLTPGDLQDLLLQLNAYLTRDQVRTIENLFDQYSGRMFNQSPQSRGVWNRWIPRYWKEAYKQAYEKLKKAAQRQKAVRQLNMLLPNALSFSLDDPIVSNYFREAYSRVTSKISLHFKSQAINEIVTGLRDGKSWDTIARNLYKKVGLGSRYHWKRLVRTEMTFTYGLTAKESYQRAQAGFVKWVTAINPCPICTGLKGYYRLENAPRPASDSHPNCRCVITPFFRLPRGVSIIR